MQKNDSGLISRGPPASDDPADFDEGDLAEFLLSVPVRGVRGVRPVRTRLGSRFRPDGFLGSDEFLQEVAGV
jgi:hypothetical protein